MITVTTTSGQIDQFDEANGWHVDEVGDLHVRKPTSGNVATYARGLWVCAREAKATTVTPIVEIDGEAIVKALGALQKRHGIKDFA